MNSKVNARFARFALLLFCSAWQAGSASADSPAVLHGAANLPIPCAGQCGADKNLTWVGANGAATWKYAENNPSKMVITQQTEAAILNWQNFNIGRANSLQFVQPSAASRVLNRIHGADPSTIAGTLSANGKVYLLNQNGIVFKQGAQVNVGSLVASTLNIDDKLFEKTGLQALEQGDPVFMADATRSIGVGGISVERGAHLHTAQGGLVMLVAPNVTNEGLIETPDGQTILAAGATAYVESGADSGIAGLVVEVNGGGKAVNLGDISVGKGDVELVGLAVQQLGRISARTSVSINGTIRLLAQDSVVNTGGTTGKYIPTATRGGDLVLGEHSLTEVLPDLGDTTTSVDDQEFSVSKVQLQGKYVELKNSSRIVAPAGQVDVVAALNPSAPNSPLTEAEKDPARGEAALVGIRLSEGAVIDVSGTTSTVLEMSRNIVDIELRANELADSPLQRTGVLRGESVKVDVRTVDVNGRIPLANVSGAIALIGRTVEERSAVGGAITLNSRGEIDAAPGSRLDVSGGSVNYNGGVVATTKLVSGEKMFDIANAPADLIYDTILGDDAKESDKWGTTVGGSGNRAHFEAGYVEGKNAGSVRLQAPLAKWHGDLKGTRTLGPYQLDRAKQPVPGSLTIGRPDPSDAATKNFVMGAIRLQTETDVSSAVSTFSTEMLRRSGLENVSIFSNGTITLAQGAPLVLPVGGVLSLDARQIELLSDIVVPSGTVNVTSRDTVSSDPTADRLSDAGYGDVSLAAGARVSVAGAWTNESPLVGGVLSSVVALHGGAVNLTAAKDLRLFEGSVLDAQGGAWLRADGSLQKGKGGSISLASRSVDSEFMLGSQLLGYGFGGGGTFSLTGPKVDIVSQAEPSAASMQFTPAFFGANGFSTVKLTANAGNLAIAEGLEIAPQLRTRSVKGGFRRLPTGASLDSVGDLGILPDDLRGPVNLSFATTAAAAGSLLSSDYGKVSVGQGARIMGEAGAAITLTSNYQLELFGEIHAPAGAISLQVNQLPTSPKYTPEQGLWLGANSVLAANGVERLRRSGVHIVRAVEDAGSISLGANVGYLMIEPGAKIEVSAVAGTADLILRNGALPQAVATAGRAGIVSVTAAEAAFLGGEFQALAASPRTPGGEFVFRFGRAPNVDVANLDLAFPAAERQLELRTGLAGWPEFPALTGLPGQWNGVAVLDVAQLQAAGFDSIDLHSDNVISLGSVMDWRVPGSLTLDAPILSAADGVVASVSANYLRVGNSDTNRQKFTRVPGVGNAELRLSAQWFDLIGNSVADKVSSLFLHADRDMRMIGVVNDATTEAASSLQGRFDLAGDLTIEAGRVYPTTLTHFTLEATGSDARAIRFERAGISSGEILSAGGRLMVVAPVIEQFGDLRAPHGAIELNAGKRLELGSDSTTSVAAGTVPVPYGSLSNGKEWTYSLGAGGLAEINAPPEKRIALTAPDLVVSAGALIDVSGGGDLSAFEFLPGPGGSKDVLADSSLYAIVPVIGSAIAPYDFQYGLSANYTANRVVYLSGVPGLADGSYTLLPAHFGLLPGAMLVREIKTLSGLTPGNAITQTDGSVLVAGRSTRPGSLLLDDKWLNYRVSPGALARQQSEFVEKTATQVFSELAGAGGSMLPADAGLLAISARTSIVMDGVVRAGHSPSSHGARVDILAPEIRITAPGVLPANNDALLLDVGTIARFGAEDLLLGGLRTYGVNGVGVDVGAMHIVIDPNVSLQGETITLAANKEIHLAQGSQLRSFGEEKGAATQNWAIGAANRAGSGDGVLLQVSRTPNVQIVRTSDSRAAGALVLDPDSVVQGNSVILDATGSMKVGGSVDASTAIDIGVAGLLLGDAPAQTNGTTLPGELTKDWIGLSQVRLRSYGGIDFFGDVTLGSPSLKRLIIQAPALRAAGSAAVQDVRLVASELIFDAGVGKLTSSTLAGDRKLAVNADRVQLADGDSLFEGFSSITFNVANELVATETGSLQAQGDVSINAPIITTATGVDYQITTLAALEIQGATAGMDRPEGLGGRLLITAGSVLHNGLIDLPSGTIAMTATGAGGLTVGASGVVRTAGQHRPLLDGAAFETPGGEVTLLAQQGDLAVARTAVIDVSGGGVGADAGYVSLFAPEGSLKMAGVINGTAGAGGRASQANVDAKNIVELDLLAQGISNTGVTGVQSYRVREGDIRIGAGTKVTAGELVFASDNGAIDVDGELIATRARGGSVRLVAKHDVSVNAGAVIRATASDSKEAGVVELESIGGWVRVADGSLIEAGSANLGGVVRLIASMPLGAAIKVDRLPSSSFSNVADLVVMGMLDASNKVKSGQITSAVQAAIRADLGAFNEGLEAQRAALSVDSLQNLRVVPGVRIDVDGDVKLTTDKGTDWDFSKWRFGDVKTGAEAGMLVLRAGGSVTLSSSLSDGFDVAAKQPDSNSVQKTGTLKTGPSWSYRVVAGADRGAADAVATVRVAPAVSETDGAKTIKVESGKWVRTGQGEIRLVAAHDIVLAGKGNLAAVVYTAGAPLGFDQPYRDRPDYKTLFSNFTINYPEHGGDITLIAGRDIQAQPTKQLFTQWMPRSNKAGATWGIDFAEFHQGVAALAGGNVTIAAGGNLVNLSVSVPTIGLSVSGASPDASVYAVANGGDLQVRAGGDILSGLFYAGHGTLTVRAGGKIDRGAVSDANVPLDSSRLSALFAVGRGLVDISARKGVTLDAVINPTMLVQGNLQGAVSNSATKESVTGKPTPAAHKTNFFTYDDETAVKVSSLVGNARLINEPQDIKYYDGGGGTLDNQFPVYPSNLVVTAPVGDIRIKERLTMIPSPRGQLTLLAGGDIVAGEGASSGYPGINMSDADPKSLPQQSSPANSQRMGGVWEMLDSARYAAKEFHARSPVHAGDSVPVLLVAGNDIRGGVYLPKSLRVTAGRDIENFDAQVQNLASTDVSVVNAGRDLVFPATPDKLGNLIANDRGIEVNGPGSLFVFAGRDVALGASVGIVSKGNLGNPALAENGANIFVYTSLAADFVDWLQQKIQPKTDASEGSLEVQHLLGFVSQRLGRTVSDPIEAWSEFIAMPAVVQRPLVLEFIADGFGQGSGALEARLAALGDVFAQRLVEAGIAHNAGGNYDVGWDAIAKAFPGKNYAGDLDLYFSQIKTEDGGDVRLFVPGGFVDAGRANVSSGGDKEAGELGIVAQDLGRISIFAHGDVKVNESRIFTLKGGDILIWSSQGSIDAGRGAKSAISAPKPKIVVNEDGSFKFDFKGAVAGSGIRIINTDSTIESGTVDLIAPGGTVNAGDAGIGSKGGLRIAAVSVTGTDNIQVTGTSTGVPTTDVGSLSVGLSGQADASANATKGAQESIAESSAQNSATPNADSALAYLEVMIQEFGGE